MTGVGPEIDLGSGYTLQREERALGSLIGYSVTGPASPHCRSPYGGRCGGLAPTDPAYESKAHWTIVSEEPLTLQPSIQCTCNLEHPGEGQHGFVTNGRWVNAGGIVG